MTGVVTIVSNNIQPYNNGGTWKCTPPNVVFSANGQTLGENSYPSFTPILNVTIARTGMVTQIGGGASFMCGVGYTKLLISIIGNTSLIPSVDDKSFINSPNSDSATEIETTALVEGVPKAWIVTAGSRPYYVLTATLQLSRMTVVASIYSTPDVLSPNNLGAVYNDTSASFTPGAVFRLKNMNLHSGGTFNSFGDTTRMVTDNAMYSTPWTTCDVSNTNTTYWWTCPQNIGQTVVPQLEEMFTFDQFMDSNGELFLMLRNLKYGYIYMNDTHDSTWLGNDVASTTDLSSVRDGKFGKWHIVSALGSTIPSSPFWWDQEQICFETENAAFNLVGTKTWTPQAWTTNLNISGASVRLNTNYLFYTDINGFNYTLQTGCLQMGKEMGPGGDVDCAVPKRDYSEQGVGNIRKPDYTWSQSKEPDSFSPLLYSVVANGPQICNSKYAFAPFGAPYITAPISAIQQWLPYGPAVLKEPPTSMWWWAHGEYNDGAAASYNNWFYESQAVNSNFYFELLNDADVEVLSNDSSFDYSALCYQVVNSSYPYAVLESSAGLTTCPTWAMVGYPKLPSASPAVCAPGKADKSTGHTSTASTCTKWTPDIDTALAANRKQAAATFISDVCGNSYNNGQNGYVCLDLLDQTSSRCSGFRTQNFAKACAFACSENPDACDIAKHQYCSGGVTDDDKCGYACDNDCACQMATSPFLNTMTEIPSTNGLTLAEYKKAENLAVDQAADVQCWWHPCVVDTYPALQTTTGECQISTYLSCIAEAQGGTITAGSTVDIDLYNACYLSQLTGSSKGNSSASNAQNNVKPADDGSTGGPAAAPPPVVKKKKGLSLAAILGIVGGVVVFVAVALFVGYAVAKKKKKA